MALLGSECDALERRKLQALGFGQKLRIVLRTFLLATAKCRPTVFGVCSSSLVLVECPVDLLELTPIYSFTSSSHSVLVCINSFVLLGTMMGLPGSQIFKFKKERCVASPCRKSSLSVLYDISGKVFSRSLSQNPPLLQLKSGVCAFLGEAAFLTFFQSLSSYSPFMQGLVLGQVGGGFFCPVSLFSLSPPCSLVCSQTLVS